MSRAVILPLSAGTLQRGLDGVLRVALAPQRMCEPRDVRRPPREGLRAGRFRSDVRHRQLDVIVGDPSAPEICTDGQIAVPTRGEGSCALGRGSLVGLIPGLRQLVDGELGVVAVEAGSREPSRELDPGELLASERLDARVEGV